MINRTSRAAPSVSPRPSSVQDVFSLYDRPLRPSYNEPEDWFLPGPLGEHWLSTYPAARSGDGSSGSSRGPITRVTQACEGCRRKKIKCDMRWGRGGDGDTGKCKKCQDTGHDCVFIEGSQKKRGPQQGTTRSTIARDPEPSTRHMPPSMEVSRSADGGMMTRGPGPRVSPPIIPLNRSDGSLQDYYASQRMDERRDSGRSTNSSIETPPLRTPDDMSRRPSYGFFSHHQPSLGQGRSRIPSAHQHHPYHHQRPSPASSRHGSTSTPGHRVPLPSIPGSPTFRYSPPEPRSLASHTEQFETITNRLGETIRVPRIVPGGLDDYVARQARLPSFERSSSFESVRQPTPSTPEAGGSCFGPSGRTLPPPPGMMVERETPMRRGSGTIPPPPSELRRGASYRG